jgi:hypothetical protein
MSNFIKSNFNLNNSQNFKVQNSKAQGSLEYVFLLGIGLVLVALVAVGIFVLTDSASMSLSSGGSSPGIDQLKSFLAQAQEQQQFESVKKEILKETNTSETGFPVSLSGVVTSTGKGNGDSWTYNSNLNSNDVAKWACDAGFVVNSTNNGCVAISSSVSQTCNPLAPAIMTGSGTLAIPFGITDCCQLQAIGASQDALTKNYKLLNDIDCSASSGWDSGKGFKPIKFEVTEKRDFCENSACNIFECEDSVGCGGVWGTQTVCSDSGYCDVSSDISFCDRSESNCTGVCFGSWIIDSENNSSYCSALYEPCVTYNTCQKDSCEYYGYAWNQTECVTQSICSVSQFSGVACNNEIVCELPRGCNSNVLNDIDFVVSTHYFLGTLNGNNKKISNLTINRSSESIVGLFSRINDSFNYNQNIFVKDLTLENFSVVGGMLVGSLAGQSNGLVFGVNSINSSVKAVASFNTRSGGLVGLSSGLIENSSFSGGLVAGRYSVGGLVGTTFYNEGIKNSVVSNSNIKYILNNAGSIFGLKGQNTTNPIFNCPTNDCTATNVTITKVSSIN